MDVDAVAQDLYALAPEDFIEARKARAQEARAAGDRDGSRGIDALRKPTVAAWLVNRLARAAKDEIAVLLDLGDEMRAGLRGLSGDEMRALTRRRLQLVGALVTQAQQLAAADGRKVGADALAAVKASLEATLADPASADAVRAGCLSEPLDVSGFGFGELAARRDDVEDKPPGEGATVADLDAHRERRAQAVRDAEAAVDEAATELDDARESYDEAVKRARKAERARAAADKQVETLKRKLDEATSELERRAQQSEKRSVSQAEAAEAVDEAEDALDEAKDRLARLTH